ncbi:hypothetical protein BC829DRAFT_112524 [Chytridium lagenaria]|nr:hypothetical protein BC829DRAFT_112524 [Chytridium lagenaria]
MRCETPTEKLTKAYTSKPKKETSPETKKGPLEKLMGNPGIRKRGMLFHINRRVEARESFKDLLKEVKAGVRMEKNEEAVATPADDSEMCQRWLLCGLHACGDLTSATIHHFLTSDAQILACVSCCYNKLTEAIPSTAPTWESTKDTHDRQTTACKTPGYPMSQYFHSDLFHLGFTARTLACQATSRWTTQEGARDAYRRHHYRALLQYVICDRGVLGSVQECSNAKKGIEDGDVDGGLVIGRLKPNAFANGFSGYVHVALTRLGVNVEAIGLLRRF